MNLKNLLKNKTIIIAIISFALGALIYNYSTIVFQEGNPWPEIKGIVQLALGKANIVKLSDSDNRYITRTKDGRSAVDGFLKNKSYEFVEQLGSGYFYKSSDSNLVANRRQYSRFFLIWTVTENSGNSQVGDNLWATITNDQGVTFQYPKELLAKYVSVVEWPPVITTETGLYSCKTTPAEISGVSEIVSQRLVDGRTYCVNIKNEGAAGSTYSSYVYTTARIKVSFTLRYPNCGNYEDEQRKACASEREAFDIDAMVDRIVQTIK